MKMVEGTREAVLYSGKIKLSVRTDPSGTVWRYCDFCFGSHSEMGFARNEEVWPREAIAQARAELDELERKLEEDNGREN